ncbi:LysM peptidoglycan-binding domain-containing protein [uncultured Polaribacter sp.]|uniref:LysM peptidoglycan-binding domain-containing protein n=1 Tax=uncultured Polaribacter sp. TaxID=174711 RepID=UPI00262DAAFE|nr:LysM peptidoglycan-binding domain-containing protein [uncultured Polaribacter sp.]
MKHLTFFVFLCILTFTVSCGQQKKYIEYKVKEGETMRVIANKLDMKTKDLLRLNPDVSRKPGANTIIIIPNKEIKTAQNNTKNIELNTKKNIKQPKDTIKNTVVTSKEKEKQLLIATLEKEYKIHEVKKGDTFFSLTRFYNVTQEDLLTLNPILSEGLKLGQIIKIMPLEEVFDEEDLIYEDHIAKDVVIKAAILLPFRAEELDTLSAQEIFGKSKLATIVTDLYLGAALAIDSLRKQGVQIDLKVYDTGRNSTKIKAIIATEDLNENDVLIGPLYSEEVVYIAEKVETPVVFPVYSKKQNNFNSKLIVKTAPNKRLFRETLLNYLDESVTDGNIIIVGDGKAESDFNAKQITNALSKKDSIDTIIKIIPENGYIKKEKFTEVLKPNMKNIVVLTTDDNVIVASAINSLISLPDEVTASVFTFDKISAFNKIDNSKLAQLNFTYVSNEYTRDDSFRSSMFHKAYLKKNHVLPSYYATRGFDVTYDVLMRLASGNSLKSTFDEGYSYRVENKFDYTDKLFKTPENKGLYIVKYNEDLTLTRIK